MGSCLLRSNRARGVRTTYSSAIPHTPSLQFKRLRAYRPTYSIRVGLGYRALGIRFDETLVWYWIGPHAEYDRLISQLK